MRQFFSVAAVAAAATVAVAVPAVARAAASFDACTGFVDTLPAVISTPGTWCLRKDLTTGISSGSAIEIAADSVTLACNGYRIASTAKGATTAEAVRSANQAATEVRDCTIRGFHDGIDVRGSAILVHRNRIDQAVTGITVATLESSRSPQMAAATVRRNVVVDTTSGAIEANGAVIVEENVVDGVSYPVGGALSVSAFHRGGVVRGNVVRNVERGYPIAVWGVPGVMTDIRENVVFAFPQQDPMMTGIRCLGDGTLLASGNIVTGFVVGIVGCADAGNETLDVPPLAP